MDQVITQGRKRMAYGYAVKGGVRYTLLCDLQDLLFLCSSPSLLIPFVLTRDSKGKNSPHIKSGIPQNVFID